MAVESGRAAIQPRRHGAALCASAPRGAPRFQVLRLSAREPDLSRAEVVVPQDEGAIAEIAAAADALYFPPRDGVNPCLPRLPPCRAVAAPPHPPAARPALSP